MQWISRGLGNIVSEDFTHGISHEILCGTPHHASSGIQLWTPNFINSTRNSTPNLTWSSATNFRAILLIYYIIILREILQLRVHIPQNWLSTPTKKFTRNSTTDFTRNSRKEFHICITIIPLRILPHSDSVVELLNKFLVGFHDKLHYS